MNSHPLVSIILRILMLQTVNAAVVYRLLIARRRGVLVQSPAELSYNQRGYSKARERVAGIFSLKDFGPRLVDDRIAQVIGETPSDREGSGRPREKNWEGPEPRFKKNLILNFNKPDVVDLSLDISITHSVVRGRKKRCFLCSVTRNDTKKAGRSPKVATQGKCAGLAD